MSKISSGYSTLPQYVSLGINDFVSSVSSFVQFVPQISKDFQNKVSLLKVSISKIVSPAEIILGNVYNGIHYLSVKSIGSYRDLGNNFIDNTRQAASVGIVLIKGIKFPTVFPK